LVGGGQRQKGAWGSKGEYILEANIVNLGKERVKVTPGSNWNEGVIQSRERGRGGKKEGGKVRRRWWGGEGGY